MGARRLAATSDASHLGYPVEFWHRHGRPKRSVNRQEEKNTRVVGVGVGVSSSRVESRTGNCAMLRGGRRMGSAQAK